MEARGALPVGTGAAGRAVGPRGARPGVSISCSTAEAEVRRDAGVFFFEKAAPLRFRLMIRSCGATLSLCNFAVYLTLRRRAFFSAGLLRTARMETKTPPQDPNEESSPRQDPAGNPAQF